MKILNEIAKRDSMTIESYCQFEPRPQKAMPPGSCSGFLGKKKNSFLSWNHIDLACAKTARHLHRNVLKFILTRVKARVFFRIKVVLAVVHR